MHQADYRTVAWTVVLLFSLGGCATSPAEPGIAAAGLVGNWRLLAVETLRDNGEISTAWMGEKPVGLITYQSNGLMSVQFMRDPRPVFASGSRSSATPEEIRKAFFGYYAYWGTYVVHVGENSVSHQVVGSLYPEEVGIAYERFFTFDSGRLVLTTAPITYEGRQIVNRLAWEKMLP